MSLLSFLWVQANAEGSERMKGVAVRKEVDYDGFVKRYWPKVKSKMVFDCSPLLVWREIQTLIKGSAGVVQKEVCCLKSSKN